MGKRKQKAVNILKSNSTDILKSKKRYINGKQNAFHIIYYSYICSTWPPLQGIIYCKQVTNLATAEFSRSECTHNISERITSFSTDKLNKLDWYTWDFKYQHNFKSFILKSGDWRGHGNQQLLLMILSSPNIHFGNSLIRVPMWPSAVSCMNMNNVISMNILVCMNKSQHE